MNDEYTGMLGSCRDGFAIGGWVDVVAIITMSDEHPFDLIIGKPGDDRILSITGPFQTEIVC